MHADFRELTPLEKVQRYIKDKANKEKWLEAFGSIDELQIHRVPVPDFFDVLQVIMLHCVLLISVWKNTKNSHQALIKVYLMCYKLCLEFELKIKWNDLRQTCCNSLASRQKH